MYWRTSTIEILPAVEDDDANLRIQEPSGRDFFGTDETTVSARRFINDVSALLDQISRSVIGETILNGIKFTGKSMTISPYLNARAAQLKPSRLPFGRCNALGGRDIEFSPGRAVVCGRELPAASAAFRPVEILLHELFHTFRVLSKKFKPSDVNIPDRVYDDSEEFHAILICNLFIVDPLYTAGNASQLRKHHKDKSLLPESETKPFGFFLPVDAGENVGRFALHRSSDFYAMDRNKAERCGFQSAARRVAISKDYSGRVRFRSKRRTHRDDHRDSACCAHAGVALQRRAS